MTDREKLVKLVHTAIAEWEHGEVDEKIADHLISNGVTFQKWIPVTERFPEVYEVVIVWTKFREIGEAKYDGKRFVWIDDEGFYDYAYVTHWMPLPNPPKENENGEDKG